jgi:hypothetical protein
MTVASINTTVTTIVAAELGLSVADQYSGAITAISRALEAREYDIVDAVAERANEDYGVSKREVATILHEAGLSERPAPVVVPVTVTVLEDPFEDDDAELTPVDGKESKKARIARIEEQVASLATAVSELTALAKRHLGASL